MVSIPLCLAASPKGQNDTGFIDVREYGETGFFSTIQRAIDEGLPNTINGQLGKTLLIPRGEWYPDVPLRINQRSYIRLIGAGASVNGTVIRCPTHIEVLGSRNISFENMYLKGEGADVGVVTGRSPGWSNSALVQFRDVQFYGDFRKAAYYNVGSEMNRFENSGIAVYYPNQACVTIAGTNVLGLETSIPISDGGTYHPKFTGCNIMGDTQVGMRIFGQSTILEDVYIYTRNGTASIEMVGGGDLVLRNSGFEGSPEATLKLTYQEGSGNVFMLNMDVFSFGNPSAYAIRADDQTNLRNSTIKTRSFRKAVRLWGVQNSDLRGLCVFDYRDAPLHVQSGFLCKLAVGPGDTFTYSGLIGTTVENYKDPYHPKIEQYGFVS